MKQIDRDTPPDLELHLIADNYATHKHPKVRAWPEKHPRFKMHFTPTSSSWLNLVERLRFPEQIANLEPAMRRRLVREIVDRITVAAESDRNPAKPGKDRRGAAGGGKGPTARSRSRH